MEIDMQPSIGLKDAILQRHSVRSFRSDSIPEVILEEILRLTLLAPSSYNLQPWRFILVKKPENKAKLQACAFNQEQITKAPIVIICCGDRRVIQLESIESVIKLAKKTGRIKSNYADYLQSQIPQFFTQHPSFESMETWTNRQTMIAVAYMMIIAKSFGVDSCPMEVFVTSQVKAAFDIPSELDVCCLLCLGYTDETLKHSGSRFSLQEVCFSETYGQEFQL